MDRSRRLFLFRFRPLVPLELLVAFLLVYMGGLRSLEVDPLVRTGFFFLCGLANFEIGVFKP